MSPIKLMPIIFEIASPSTRLPAIETTIIAKKMPVKLLMSELDRMTPNDKEDILKTAETIKVLINAHIMGMPIRANK